MMICLMPASKFIMRFWMNDADLPKDEESSNGPRDTFRATLL